MKRTNIQKFVSAMLMCTMFVFMTASVCPAADVVQPSSGITKHSPEVRTSPEQDVSKIVKKPGAKHNWYWWALGAVVLIGGIAAAAGGGGGGGGDGGEPAKTGSATVTW